MIRNLEGQRVAMLVQTEKRLLEKAKEVFYEFLCTLTSFERYYLDLTRLSNHRGLVK